MELLKLFITSGEKMDNKTGKRFNNGKLRWRNFPKFLVRPLIEVGQFGETKYETFNFLRGLTVLDCMDCADRHMDKFIDPSLPDIDGESKCHHLAHVAWNCLVALYMIKTRPELDDRYKGEPTDREVFAEMEAELRHTNPEVTSLEKKIAEAQASAICTVREVKDEESNN